MTLTNKSTVLWRFTLLMYYNSGLGRNAIQWKDTCKKMDLLTK